MLEKLEEQFTKYEVARILGARALQIAMDAPLLLKIDEKELEEIHYNPIEIAKKELLAGVLPITVNRPLPKKKEGKIKTVSKESIDTLKKKKEEKFEESAKEDEKLEMEEESEEKKIAEDAEIMEMAQPEDEEEVEEEPVEEEY